MSTNDLLTRLRKTVGMFQGFSEAELVGLLKQSSLQERHADGDVVFREGMPSSRMYVLLTGQVRITRNPGLDHEEVLAQLEPGACFGEMGLIDPSPRSARATAVGAVTLLVLSETALRHAPAEMAAKLYRNFALILAGRLRLANEQVARMGTLGREQTQQVRRLTQKRSEGDDEALRRAELNEADLSGAQLREADLRGAMLGSAQLGEADLREADLRGADLREARFTSCDLRRANLAGADLRGAVFRGTNFEDVIAGGALSQDVVVEADATASPDDGSKD